MKLKIEKGFGGELILTDLESYSESPHVFTKTEDLFQRLLVVIESRQDDVKDVGRPFGKVTVERKRN